MAANNCGVDIAVLVFFFFFWIVEEENCRNIFLTVNHRRR